MQALGMPQSIYAFGKESSLECLDNDHLLLVPRLFFLQLQQWHWPYVRARAHWILNMRLSSVWSSSIRISMMSKSLRPSDVAYFGGPRSRLSQKWDQNLCSFHSTGWFVDIYRHSMTLGKKMLPVKQGRGSYETGQPRSSTHCEKPRHLCCGRFLDHGSIRHPGEKTGRKPQFSRQITGTHDGSMGRTSIFTYMNGWFCMVFM